MQGSKGVSCLHFLENYAPTDWLVASLVILVLGSNMVKPIPMIEEFMDIFLEDLQGLLLRREIDFAIKLVLNTKLIFISSC